MQDNILYLFEVLTSSYPEQWKRRNRPYQQNLYKEQKYRSYDDQTYTIYRLYTYIRMKSGIGRACILWIWHKQKIIIINNIII